MSTESICEVLHDEADKYGVDLKIDSRSGLWYATVLTRKESPNLVVRTFQADTLEELANRVRFPERTPDGRAVYL